jgi:hypothetical protein
MALGGVSVQQIRRLINYARKYEEAAYKYFRPNPWPERYSIMDLLDKAEAKARPETVLKPSFMVKDTPARAGESEEAFVLRMRQLELEELNSDEMENGEDWVRIYTRYVKLKNDGDESGMHLEVS